jgi:hypothetical protein
MNRAIKIYGFMGLLFVFIMHIKGLAQNDTIISSRFQEYARKTVQEKVYAHTDRDTYLAGDIAWFKLYLVDGSFHQRLDLSKVAYVELIDAQNKPLVQAKIEMHGGEGSGSFFLPVTAVSGNYTLRAYTNWMKNGDVDYFFHKTVTLINTQTALPTNAVLSIPTDAITVRLFPEGGNMVVGLPGKIACQAMDASGKGLAFSGRIIDENNQAVANFRSLHAGIGSFTFTPTAGHTYKALIETNDGKQLTQELPAAYQKGTTMQLKEDGNDLSLHIENNSGDNLAYLLVHTRQLLVTARQITLINGKADITLDKNKLGDGISQITLFSSARQALCERLYFKYPTQTLELTARANAQTFNSRSKIDIDIAAAENNKNVTGASLSLSVFRIDSLQQLPAEDINSYLLLSSDLKGTIESPSWYFDRSNKTRVQAMDNLMLTHGWRRFAWEKVMQQNTPAFSFVPEYNGHLVTGSVIDRRTGKPAPQIPAYLSIVGKRTQFYPSISDQKGQVRFEMKEMMGSSEIIVQTNNTRDSLYRIDINNPFAETYAQRNMPPFRFLPTYANTLLHNSIGMQVQNIYTADKRRKFNDPQLDTVPFFKPDATYYLDAYTRFITVEEVLREYVNFMDVLHERGKLHVYLIDMTSQVFMRTKQTRYFVTDPLVLVDGVPMFDITHLMAMDPRKIRKLEILNHREFVKGSYFDGVLNWQTYTADLSDLELDPGVVAVDYEGLQPERIFYSPLYASGEDRNSRLPDFRNVLHWSPNLHTNETGHASAGFYSSDLKGKYAVVVQGLSPDGKAASGLAFLEVK